MAKLSPALKTLISASNTHTTPVWPPSGIEDVVGKIEQDAAARGLGWFPWLAIVTATTMTMDSPESIAAVSKHVIRRQAPKEGLKAAEFMREIGFMCIAMNGVRTEIAERGNVC